MEFETSGSSRELCLVYSGKKMKTGCLITKDTNYMIGVDFDNTIVHYDAVMHRVALQQGLIHSDTRKSKRDIRDRIRQLPDGEMKWQRLQAIVYGSRMEEAKLIDGVQAFFELCKPYKVKVYIISHKTEFARFNGTVTNLRVAAVTWMRKSRFFEFDGLDLSQEDVYFESTRREKIERIRYLRCTHFIDDLEETFFENSFPRNVEKILYAPHGKHVALQGIRVITSWEAMIDYFFDTNG